MTDPDHAWNALAELLGPIHEDVQLFARRIARSNAEGDDLFQDAVLRAADKLGTLRERGKFKSWMYSVVVTVHRTRCRRSFWRRFLPGDSAPDPIGDDGAQWADERASRHRASAALATLAPEQREAIVLFELHGYSLDEIAEVQAASISAVKTRLVRGRGRLRTYYEAIAPESQLTPTKEVLRGV